MSTVLRAVGLGKKYRRRWALSDCNLEVGLITPSAGEVEVLGASPTGRSAGILLAQAAGAFGLCFWRIRRDF